MFIFLNEKKKHLLTTHFKKKIKNTKKKDLSKKPRTRKFSLVRFMLASKMRCYNKLGR